MKGRRGGGGGEGDLCNIGISSPLTNALYPMAPSDKIVKPCWKSVRYLLKVTQTLLETEKCKLCVSHFPKRSSSLKVTMKKRLWAFLWSQEWNTLLISLNCGIPSAFLWESLNLPGRYELVSPTTRRHHHSYCQQWLGAQSNKMVEGECTFCNFYDKFRRTRLPPCSRKRITSICQ